MNFKKITSSLVLLLVGSNVQAQLTSAAPYCDAVYGSQYNMFNTISIKGKSFSFGPQGSWMKNDPFYYYNTTTFPDFIQGDTAGIVLNVYPVDDGEPIYFALWIDYNKNNTFESTELLMQNSNTIKKELPTFGAAVSPIKFTLTVPATALVGKTRLRLMRGEGPRGTFDYKPAYVLDPCAKGGSYGCLYDFDVNIKAKAAGTSIVESLILDRVLFTPNPAVNGTIRIDEQFKGATLDIFDLTGRLMLKQDHILNYDLDISGFSAGAYFLSIRKDGQRYMQQLLKD